MKPLLKHRKPLLRIRISPSASPEVHLTNHDFSKSGLSSKNYTVTIALTKDARTKLAGKFEGKGMKLLTVVVDGKYWGVHRYESEKDKPFVPEQSRPETFTLGVGYFSSKAEAQRLVDALK